ncbi:MAG: hypothetical protein HFG34_06080 [Eubacterium sp.]|nr:hypothetical protein [Eubacterium sp.]
MGFEKTVDNAVNGFAMWTLQFEVIIGIICAVICLVVGYRFLKMARKNTEPVLDQRQYDKKHFSFRNRQLCDILNIRVLNINTTTI